jgi:hypothetical protein
MTLAEAKGNVYSDFIGTLEANRPLGRPRHKIKYNIKKGLKDVGREILDWIHLAQVFLLVLRF